MKFEIKVKDIASSMDLLYKLNLTGYRSVHRTRLIKILEEKLLDVQREFSLILREHCGVDENYEFKENEDIDKMVISKEEFLKDRNNLYNEVFTIDNSNMKNVFKTMKEAILNCELEWSGEEADTYFILFEIFENMEGLEEK